ncbi:MAG: CpsD/CapB family tyrosine-protein kinase [Planctomycetes bacterium]|nr:CpsD/CapB family tyrosine-protein kinase [Planctomycetota bacterium]
MERGSSFAAGSAATILDEPPALRQSPASDSVDTKLLIDKPVALVEGLNEALIPYYRSSSLVAEQYRSLRTRLLSQNPHYEHRTLAITSSVPKEGKSVTTLNLGSVLAEIRHLKVLVVDGDFRRGSLATKLNQPSGPGLAEVLAGEATYAEVIRSTPIPNLSFVPAGNTQRHSPAELLTSAGAKPLFQRMLNEFHYTIVDTPPATTVSDVGVIGQLCSGVILVVRLHRTDEGAAKRTVRLLQANSIPIVGCLLVGRDAPGGRYGFGYGYRYYYDYDHYGKGKDG